MRRTLCLTGLVCGLLLAGLYGCTNFAGEAREQELSEPTVEELVPVSDTATPVRTETPEDTPTATVTPGTGSGSTQQREIDGMVEVYVPEGPFLMGLREEEKDMEFLARCVEGGSCIEEEFEAEVPQHEVFLNAYWIDQTEVTNAMYAGCVASGACTVPQDTSSHTRDNYYDDPQYGNYPVINLDWYQAETYCAWAGGHLPTEAEWEKAAAGVEGARCPWMDSVVTGELANYCDLNCGFDWKDTEHDDGYADTSPVGSYPDGVSPFGALDMAGNASEWVADWFDAGAYRDSLFNNPAGPEDGEFKGIRGGAWYNPQSYLRASSRSWAAPDLWGIGTGFRCASAP